MDIDMENTYDTIEFINLWKDWRHPRIPAHFFVPIEIFLDYDNGFHFRVVMMNFGFYLHLFQEPYDEIDEKLKKIYLRRERERAEAEENIN